MLYILSAIAGGLIICVMVVTAVKPANAWTNNSFRWGGTDG